MTLPSHIESLIQKRVEAGKYSSIEETLDAAFAALELMESENDRLRKDIAEGLAQADRGELLDGEAFFQRLLAESDARRRGSSALYQEDVEELRRNIDEGIEDARCGRVMDGAEAFALLRRNILAQENKETA